MHPSRFNLAPSVYFITVSICYLVWISNIFISYFFFIQYHRINFEEKPFYPLTFLTVDHALLSLQLMALDEVLSDRDSEDEIDDEVADIEDRRVRLRTLWECVYLFLMYPVGLKFCQVVF